MILRLYIYYLPKTPLGITRESFSRKYIKLARRTGFARKVLEGDKSAGLGFC